MIERLHALLTRTVTLIIHCAATDVCPLCTLSNTARKRRQYTVGCEHAQWEPLRRRATWLRCETHICMRGPSMTSDRHSRSRPPVCLVTLQTRFTNAVS